MTGHPTHLDEPTMRLLHEALDGDRSALERVEAQGLGADLARLRAYEERLGALYGADSEQPLRIPEQRVPSRWTVFAQRAAVIALIGGTVAGTWWYLQNVNAPAPLDGARLHRNFVINDQPDTVCDTQEKFLAYTIGTLGEPIGATFGTGITLVGWRSAGSVYEREQDQPRVLLALDAEGEEIVVVFQKREERTPSVRSDRGLYRHGERFGTIEAWEISRNDRPVVLPLLTHTP